MRIMGILKSKKNAVEWVREAFTKLKVTPEDSNKARKLQDQYQALLQKTTTALIFPFGSGAA